jgi:hypothetical protein
MAEALLRAIVALVRRTGTDLSARQIGVFFDMLPGGRSADSSRLGRQSQYFENRHLSCAKSSVPIRFGRIGVVSWFSGRRWVLGSYATSKGVLLPWAVYR